MSAPRSRSRPPSGTASVHHSHPQRPEPAQDAQLQRLLQKVVTALEAARRDHECELSDHEATREVARRLSEPYAGHEETQAIQKGWAELALRGQQYQQALLSTDAFLSTEQASDHLGIGDAAVRKRIRDRRLFALQRPVSGDYRIPLWAAFPELNDLMPAVLSAGGRDNRLRSPYESAWWLYQFLDTPNGLLHGLSPIECLVSGERLPPDRLALRLALHGDLRMAPDKSLLNVVMGVLRQELEEGLQS